MTALGAVHVSGVEQVRAALARAGVDRRPTGGSVRLAGGAPVWRAHRGRISVPLSGCELLRVAGASTARDSHHDDVVLTVRAPEGDLLRLHLAGADAPTVQDWIAAARARATVPAPRSAVTPLAPGEAVFSRISTVISERASAEGWQVTAAVPAATVPDRRWWRVAMLRRIAAASLVPSRSAVLLVLAGLATGVAALQGGADGLARYGWPSTALMALAVLLVGRRVQHGVSHVREVARLRTGPARTWRYVRFLDPSGAPALMLFSRLDNPAPVALVPLSPLGTLGDALPLHGEADVYGAVADGALAVPVINGHTCWPIGTAEQVPAAVVRMLTNGAVPAPRRDADRNVRVA